MESRTIDIWEQTAKNPPEEYLEYFKTEKEFLSNNLSTDFIVLDVGSGTGRTIRELAKSVKKFIGIDNDKTAIEASKKYLNGVKNAEIFFEDAESMHFKDNTFDVVFIGLTFCNFAESKMAVLREIKRVLKDDGSLIFSVFNEDSLKIRMKTYKDYYGGYTIIDKNKGTVRFDKDGGISEQFSKEEITKILSDADFKILEIIRGKMFYLIKARKNRS